MKEKERNTIHRDRGADGLRLGVINGVMVAVGVILSVLLLIATYRTIESYHSMETATERYINCQNSADTFQQASDYLTSECRIFVITGDIERARAFVEEVEVTRRRDNALAEIETYLTGSDSYRYLQEGKAVSDALAQRECQAMRLAAQAWGIPEAELPGAIAGAEVPPERMALSAEAQREIAAELLFGDAYQADKARIRSCVAKSVSALVEATRVQQIDASGRLSRLLRQQRGLIILLLVLIFAMVACTYLLVMRPLKRCVAHIRGHGEIPVEGSSEMRFLARTYNDMYAQNARSTEELTYSATHDSLTGVYNRTAYDAECLRVDPATVGVLIIDVDKFKEYNDSYGHDVGDRVLKRVADILMDSFRSEDFVSRIGGDEFCVIMKNVSSQMRQLVETKIRRANERLQNPEDDLPRVSISVGVAFGDRKNPTDSIFKDADTALYTVKRQGRGSCAFY